MEKEQIELLINQGLTNKQISEELNIKTGTLNSKIQKYNLSRYKVKLLKDYDFPEILRLYQEENLTCKEIGKRLKINRMTVSKILQQNGITIEKKFRKGKDKGKRTEFSGQKCLVCNKNIGKRRNLCTGCYTSLRRLKIKAWMITYKGGECSKCGNGELDMACYDFHHLDPSEKEFGLSSLDSAKRSIEMVLKELDKCVLLCANCHRSEHSNYEKMMSLEYIDDVKCGFVDELSTFVEQNKV